MVYNFAKLFVSPGPSATFENPLRDVNKLLGFPHRELVTVAMFLQQRVNLQITCLRVDSTLLTLKYFLSLVLPDAARVIQYFHL